MSESEWERAAHPNTHTLVHPLLFILLVGQQGDASQGMEVKCFRGTGRARASQHPLHSANTARLAKGPQALMTRQSWPQPLLNSSPVSFSFVHIAIQPACNERTTNKQTNKNNKQTEKKNEADNNINTEKRKQKKVKLSDWESNPGLPRDRRRY